MFQCVVIGCYGVTFVLLFFFNGKTKSHLPRTDKEQRHPQAGELTREWCEPWREGSTAGIQDL